MGCSILVFDLPDDVAERLLAACEHCDGHGVLDGGDAGDIDCRACCGTGEPMTETDRVVWHLWHWSTWDDFEDVREAGW